MEAHKGDIRDHRPDLPFRADHNMTILVGELELASIQRHHFDRNLLELALGQVRRRLDSRAALIKR